MISLASAATAGSLVGFSVTDLNGSQMAVPAGLPAARTLLLLGFRHDDQAALETWRRGLGLAAADRDWFEVPVIGVDNKVIRTMIISGMRRATPAPEDRAHLAPSFSDPTAVANSLGVDPGQPAAIVVDRSGRVLAHVAGGFDTEKARELIAALGR